jgi:hypothetical protein
MTKEPKYFDRVKGGMTLHSEDVDDATVRFILCRHGEDPAKAIAQFWHEYEGAADFTIVPLFSFGGIPRAALCTPQSLASALQSVTLEPNGRVEQAWKRLADDLCVAWPRRLQPKPKPAETVSLYSETAEREPEPVTEPVA